MKIHRLNDTVVNHIAAGEVVERPVSVVRELVDNALDAQATHISITLESAGKELIRVEDNGVGMSEEDALIAFERHATSKIQEASDLDAIETRGFRGEALSSIASVSQVLLQTRTEESKLATQIEIRGGEVQNSSQVPSQVGTVIEVAHLFFNTPARKKFLKTDRTELDRIKSWITHIALGSPQVSYELHADGKEVLYFREQKTPQARAEEIFQGSYQNFFDEYGDMSIEGRIGHPSLALAQAKYFVLLVNNRVVSDRSLLRALREGFDSTLKPTEYPVGYISIQMPPSEVDVNVHPQKSEVRFRDNRKVFQLVRNAVLMAVRSQKAPLAANGGVSFRRDDLEKPAQDIVWSEPANVQPFADHSSRAVQESLGIYGQTSEGHQPLRSDEKPFLFSELRYIGQALDCYLFCEKHQALYVLDMHAAHERYNFNLIRNRFHEREQASQQLLVPLSITLPEEQVQNCLSRQELFSNFGFELEEFGNDTIIVRAVPSMLIGKDVTTLMKEVAAIDYDEMGEGPFHLMIDQISARIACHASIRSGKKMERQEAIELLEQLDKTEFSTACPHGRPIIVSFSEFEIEKWFGRDR